MGDHSTAKYYKVTEYIICTKKNSLAVKKNALLKMASVKRKRCEIKGGSQEMAVMVKVDGKNFNNNNSGQFVLLHPRNQHKIHLSCCY